MLVSSHASASVSFALYQQSSFCMRWAVLSCPPAKVRSPQFAHIAVLVVYSPLLTITYALLLKWKKDATFFSKSKEPEGKWRFGESLYHLFSARERDPVRFMLWTETWTSDFTPKLCQKSYTTFSKVSARNLTWLSAKVWVSSSLDRHLQKGRPQNFGRIQFSPSAAWLIPWKVFLIHWHLFAALNLSLHCWEKAAPWIELNPALRWDHSRRNGNSQCSPVIQKSPLLPGR